MHFRPPTRVLHLFNAALEVTDPMFLWVAAFSHENATAHFVLQCLTLVYKG